MILDPSVCLSRNGVEGALGHHLGSFTCITAVPMVVPAKSTSSYCLAWQGVILP